MDEADEPIKAVASEMQVKTMAPKSSIRRKVMLLVDADLSNRFLRSLHDGS